MRTGGQRRYGAVPKLSAGTMAAARHAAMAPNEERAGGSGGYVYGFYNEMNRNAQQWMMRLGAELKSTEVVLEAERSLHIRHVHPSVRELSSLRSGEFLRLHESVFPGTYRGGPDIVERINENYCVFMFEDEDGLQGYIYVEREPSSAKAGSSSLPLLLRLGEEESGRRCSSGVELSV